MFRVWWHLAWDL